MFKSVAASAESSCAVTAAGGVVCWGKPLGAPSNTQANVKLNPVPGLSSGVKSVVMGMDHACALTTTGGVQCWGTNLEGQLGDGTSVDRLTPVPVSGLSSGVESIAAGDSATCAITTAHTVKCWGYDGTFSTTSNRLVPVDVPSAGNDVIQMSMGPYGQNCYLNTAGHVKCLSSANSVIKELDGFKSIASSNTSGSVTCGVTTAGGAKCWGSTFNGSLGNGEAIYYGDDVVDVTGLTSGVAQVTVGYEYACALTNLGAVKCWGLNQKGQLGNGTQTSSATPVDVAGLSNAAFISAGGAHNCVVTSAGGVKCWGEGVGGKLGNGSDSDSAVPIDLSAALSSNDTAPPVAIINLSPAPSGSGIYTAPVTVSVSAYDVGGSNVSEVRCVLNPPKVPATFADLAPGCAYFTPGTLNATGGYDLYVSSSDTSGNREAVHSVHFQIQNTGTPGTSASVLATGPGGPCVVTTAGAGKCWGTAPLGNGSNTYSTLLVDVTGLSSVSAISSGKTHKCALTAAGDASCWGLNNYAQLGTISNSDQILSVTDSFVPLKVDFLGSGVKSISAGDTYTCAVTSAGGVKCWGNPSAPLGATFKNFYIPQRVSVPGVTSGVEQVTTEERQACALTTAGGVKCWSGGPAVDVPGLTSGVTAISSGDNQTCALTTTGGVKCWGKSQSGYHATPYDVPGLTSGVTAISLGSDHACALTTAGGVKCWGQNDKGQLGNGTTTSSDTPTDVTGLTSGVKSISGSCAVLTNGTVKCWGDNASGNLGNGTTTSSLVPVNVSGFTATPVNPGNGALSLQTSLNAVGTSAAKVTISVMGAPAGASMDGVYRVVMDPACGKTRDRVLRTKDFASKASTFSQQLNLGVTPGAGLLVSARVFDPSGKFVKELDSQVCLS